MLTATGKKKLFHLVLGAVIDVYAYKDIVKYAQLEGDRRTVTNSMGSVKRTANVGEVMEALEEYDLALSAKDVDYVLDILSRHRYINYYNGKDAVPTFHGVKTFKEVSQTI